MTPLRLLILSALLALPAGETVEGFGQAVETVGGAITEEAQDAQ